MQNDPLNYQCVFNNNGVPFIMLPITSNEMLAKMSGQTIKSDRMFTKNMRISCRLFHCCGVFFVGLFLTWMSFWGKYSVHCIWRYRKIKCEFSVYNTSNTLIDKWIHMNMHTYMYCSLLTYKMLLTKTPSKTPGIL